MTETQTVETTTTQVESTPTVDNNTFVPSDFEGSEAQPVNSGVTSTEVVDTTNKETQVPSKEEEEIVDADLYLKTKLGFESWEDAEKQIKELKEKATTKKEIEFANEQSKNFYENLAEGKEEEVYNYLSEKRKLEKIVSSEVTDATAEEIIKLGMQIKYKDLTQSEIDYKFKKQYSLPKEPIQGVDEYDSDFEARKKEWQDQVQAVKQDMIIDAKLVKPDLEKFKTELVLPKIQAKEVQTVQPTQEELEKQKKQVETYLQIVDETVNSFEGINVSVKNEDVEIPLSYNISDEEKSFVANQLKEFVNSNFNANELFTQRWVSEDGSLNMKQITKDLILLNSEGKISQKFVNDAAQKSVANYIKTKSNITVTGQQQGTFTPQGDKTEQQKMAETFWSV